ncbi:MAG: 4-hydroxy-3-methylbut-2-enyl diphosphate reductase [Alphaproteobacteria bacterium]|nr:4-hydroxy-3-methylbut-2-enyl diphosphate reductase [Alphaproteobacteria bacterium]MBO4643786.1 4-hydroxy-3-methylbut-2-enyl diphosphate reductase [Alphaproteobacteria bacterium]
MPGSELKILLASPRGFCAGVTRAVQIVSMALKKFGTPVYVRHEIVHNKYVVQKLADEGAVFVNELDEVPDGSVVIFSAHGVPLSVIEEAKRRALTTIDATCPLVEKVHKEARKNHNDGRKTLLIGHKGHPEVIGTMGQIPADEIKLISSVSDIDAIPADWADNLGYVTQTTLSLDETAELLQALKSRFPSIVKPHQNDICYATTNRQKAVKAIAKKCDLLMVIGAPNSSNSKRLVEVAKEAGCAHSVLVQRAADINPDDLAGVKTLGITAGASAPEVLVREVIDTLAGHFKITLSEHVETEEKVSFPLPASLRE